MKLTLAILTLAFPCICSAGYLHTVNFDDARPAPRTVGSAHFDRGGSRFNRSDSAVGGLFTPQSVLFRPLDRGFGGNDSPSYMWSNRYLDEASVGSRGFDLYGSRAFERFDFGRLWQIDDPHFQGGSYRDWGWALRDRDGTPSTSAPEPGTIALLGAGLFGLALAARRKRAHPEMRHG
jgi:PEP-CTERM motif-containing protein